MPNFQDTSNYLKVTVLSCFHAADRYLAHFESVQKFEILQNLRSKSAKFLKSLKLTENNRFQLLSCC